MTSRDRSPSFSLVPVWVAEDSAGNVVHSSGPQFEPSELARVFSRTGRSLWPIVGIVERDVCAVVSVDAEPGEKTATRVSFPPRPCLFSHGGVERVVIEITRVEVAESLRRTGKFLAFVRRVACAARSMSTVSTESALVILGCVRADPTASSLRDTLPTRKPNARMCDIIDKNPSAWTPCAWEPTSFVFTG